MSGTVDDEIHPGEMKSREHVNGKDLDSTVYVSDKNLCFDDYHAGVCGRT